MPLKRVMIDWADGTQLIKRDGLYKNHKPYCEMAEDGDPKKAQVGRCGKNSTDYSQVTCTLPPNDSVDDCNGVKGSAGCTPAGGRHFGDSARACTRQYFEFTNDYNCSSSTASTLVSNLAGVVSAEAQTRVLALGYTPDDKVCVFQPRVQVLDNWGWCNGVCKDANVPGSGCYDEPDESKNSFNECSDLSDPNFFDKHWTNYKGAIVVTP